MNTIKIHSYLVLLTVVVILCDCMPPSLIIIILGIILRADLVVYMALGKVNLVSLVVSIGPLETDSLTGFLQTFSSW